ncbi:hypothetical protein C5167_028147 [Papaver somniferum]|nr:hypothetical protein C5167_028147 [Papaver somniferum]
MGSISFQTKILSKFLNLVYFILLNVFLCDHTIVVGQYSPSKCGTDEIKALNSIRDGLNNTFLNQQWNGSECFLNDQPAWYGIEWLDGRVTGITLEAISLIGEINVLALTNLTELTYLSLKNNGIAGSLMDFSNTKKLMHIDLSYNEFNGFIPDSVLNLKEFETLLLQENNLTGSIRF